MYMTRKLCSGGLTMISKQQKNAYYVEIINTAKNLLEEYNKIESSTLKDTPQHEFPNIKKEISSLNRIYNNGLIMLLKNGMKFSTGADKWSGCNKAIICINGNIHEISMQNVKTILGGGHEKILDESFSADPYDNFSVLPIDISEIKKSYSTLFEEYTPKRSEINRKNSAPQPVGTVIKKNRIVESKNQQKSAVIQEKQSLIGNNIENNKKPISKIKGEDRAGKTPSNERPQNIKKDNKTENKGPETRKQEETRKNTDQHQGKQEIKKPITDDRKKTLKKPDHIKGLDKAIDKKAAQPIEKTKQVKQKVPIFDDIDEFFDEIGDDVKIEPKKLEKPSPKAEQKPHIIKKPVLSMPPDPHRQPIESSIIVPSNEKHIVSEAIAAEEKDIMQIDDDDAISTIISEEEADIFVGPKDLLMDAYKIQKVDPETNEIKEFTILVAPLNSPGKDEFKAPIFAFGRTGRISSTACSMTADKPLLQLSIDGEAFIIRGSWSEGDFISLVYPQNVDNQNINVTNIKKMRPEGKMFIGHNVFHIQDLKFHILPLASSNNKNGYASLFVCVENMKSKKYEMADLMRGNNALYKYSDKEYRIFAKWKDEKLVHKLL